MMRRLLRRLRRGKLLDSGQRKNWTGHRGAGVHVSLVPSWKVKLPYNELLMSTTAHVPVDIALVPVQGHISDLHCMIVTLCCFRRC
jgi:hypothetical protein